MDNNLNKFFEQKVLENIIKDKITAIKNYIDVLKQQVINLQLRYRLNEFQDSIEQSTEVILIYQNLVKKELKFHEAIINNYMLSYINFFSHVNNNLNLL